MISIFKYIRGRGPNPSVIYEEFFHVFLKTLHYIIVIVMNNTVHFSLLTSKTSDILRLMIFSYQIYTEAYNA